MRTFEFWPFRSSDRSNTEMILRRESFGGTLFHPADATFVQLDHEGYDVVKRVIAFGGAPRSAQERELIEEVRRALPTGASRARVVEHAVPDAPEGLRILSTPTLVDFQITERCGLGCPQCYASSVVKGDDVSWEDAKLAVAQMREAGVCQVALGGGEPVLHPRLPDLLALIRDQGMVPNMTTTGLGMTKACEVAIKKNCGAIAMSLEGVGDRFAARRKQGFDVFHRTVEKFLALDVPLVLQVTVSAGNIDYLEEIADYCATVSPLYGVVFLAHKPAGRAHGYDRPLAAVSHPHVHSTVLKAIAKLRPHTRVGFDCCFTPAMVGFERELGLGDGTIVEGCSATRSGIGLTPKLDVLPCTFLPSKGLGNLREHTLLEIWRGRPSGVFRGAMSYHAKSDSRCRGCAANSNCMGGCSVWSLTGCVTKES